MEQDTFSSLKIKLYLFSSTDTNQRQDQIHITVKEKKGGGLTGPPTYTSGLTIEIITYGGIINPAEFCKSLDQEQQSPKQISE